MSIALPAAVLALAEARSKALDALRRRKQQHAVANGEHSVASSCATSAPPPSACLLAPEGTPAATEPVTEPTIEATIEPPKPRKRRFQLTDAPPHSAPQGAASTPLPSSDASTEPSSNASATDQPSTADARPKKSRWSSSNDATTNGTVAAVAVVAAPSAADVATTTPTPSTVLALSGDATSSATVALTAAPSPAAAATMTASTALVLSGEAATAIVGSSPTALVPHDEAGAPNRRTRFQPAPVSASLLTIHTTHLPTNVNLNLLCAGMSTHQADSVLTHLRIEAIQRQLNLLANGRPIDEVDPRPIDPVTRRPTRARSPSPDPIYDAEGKRTNLRTTRLKDRLVKLQKSIVDEALKRNPEFRPPTGWKKTEAGRVKYERKIRIPLDEYPDYNFKGAIIGVRGATQQELERRTGCKIAIRGQNSWSDACPEAMRKHCDDDHEPQHVWIAADTEEKLARGIAEIEKKLVPVSDEQRRKELQALALANGWVSLDPRPCNICGALTHLMRDCPDRQNGRRSNSQVSCALCASRTHPTFDCGQARGKTHSEVLRLIADLRVTGKGGLNADQRTDAEYEAFIAELFDEDSSSSTSNAVSSTIARGTDGMQLALMPSRTRADARDMHLLGKEPYREYRGEMTNFIDPPLPTVAPPGAGWSSAPLGPPLAGTPPYAVAPPVLTPPMAYHPPYPPHASAWTSTSAYAYGAALPPPPPGL